MIIDEDGNGRNQECHYRSVIGQINYPAETTKHEIIFAVHQCAKYSIDPKQSHEVYVKSIERDLNKKNIKV